MECQRKRLRLRNKICREADFASRYAAHTVGGSIHQELWVPAEELADFNRRVVGTIEVIAEYHALAEAAYRLCSKEEPPRSRHKF